MLTTKIRVAYYIKTNSGYKTGGTIVVPKNILPNGEGASLTWQVVAFTSDGGVNTHTYAAKVFYIPFNLDRMRTQIPYLIFSNKTDSIAFKKFVNKT